MRDYLGVDWADQTHAVCVMDEAARQIVAHPVPHTAEGFSEWGRELDEWRAQGIELWAAIERRESRVVDFLLDHGVGVYPGEIQGWGEAAAGSRGRRRSRRGVVHRQLRRTRPFSVHQETRGQ